MPVIFVLFLSLFVLGGLSSCSSGDQPSSGAWVPPRVVVSGVVPPTRQPSGGEADLDFVSPSNENENTLRSTAADFESGKQSGGL